MTGKSGSRQAIWSRTPAVTGSVQDLCGNLGKRDNTGEDAQLSAGARHAVNGASGFILANGRPPWR